MLTSLMIDDFVIKASRGTSHQELVQKKIQEPVAGSVSWLTCEHLRILLGRAGGSY